MEGWPEPEIDYPAEWSYKLVGDDEQAIRLAIVEVVGDQAHEVTLSRTSSAGKYVSLKVELVVHSHEARRGLANAFNEHPAIKFVL
jgi:putative lipoic acid-binding regulatory protein